MSLDNWDEVKTAYHVAKLGTVSGAAEALGVHHATVIRHIDALEARLGTKLFQRHARGYTSTEAGEDLLQIARTTDDQFTQLAGRLRGRGNTVSGDLVVTSLSFHSQLLAPILTRFQQEHPEVIVRYLTGDRVFRLEYGEAHVAVRAGSAPDQPDNVVQPFIRQRYGLYATQDYIDRNGIPTDDEDLKNHYFVGHDMKETRAPFYQWLNKNVPSERIVFRGTEARSLLDAVLHGAGIGFAPVWEGPQYPDLKQVMAPRDEWSSPLWLVTHVDLHRTAKVQSFLKFLKQEAKGWDQSWGLR
ncbi:MAG: LysR family transcriptional regulator [Pseudomonadota bacterium]